MSELANEHPHEYPSGFPALSANEVAELVAHVPEWTVAEGRLARTFNFKDFQEAFSFLTRVALLAEAEGHHPDMFCSWSRVDLSFWTHTVDGLTRNDFIMAAKIESLIS
ncbi:MAG TPA: 4a-hydroxytetrahydrobiopterin dehydratase [Actinomycetota bacterium]|nr:4a-hydroxytetrahydrobiopterin dehydratase [Actinomycetota bacterium]